MEGHPIENLIRTAMGSIKDMIDVNTIVGEAVETSDGTVIIPVSKVTFGFAAGGGEFDAPGKGERANKGDKPFSGGSGAGVSVQPVAFMVVGKDQIRLLPVTQNAMIERIIDIAPQLLEQVKEAFKKDNQPVAVRPN